MSVILRKRKLADGRVSLFLDIHHKGVRSKEYLHIQLIAKPKNPAEKELNKVNQAIAESTRAKREIAINSEEYEILPSFKKKAYFNEYFKIYAETLVKKGNRTSLAAYTAFMKFMENKPVTFRHITEKMAEEFRDYLVTSDELKGGTPSIYFRAFKKVVRKACKEKVIRDNPVVGISLSSSTAIHKDVLTMDEIIKLSNTYCKNGDVKKAFIFSCLTGIRLCDIRRLTWGHIKETKEGLMIEMKQNKTGKQLKGNLNQDAIGLIGNRGSRDELIFDMPGQSTVKYQLYAWGKKAGINKHITYHVARHSFGTNLIYYGTDVKTASQLLGHTSLAYTTLYLHISDSMKQDAVNKLPSLKTF